MTKSLMKCLSGVPDYRPPAEPDCSDDQATDWSVGTVGQSDSDMGWIDWGPGGEEGGCVHHLSSTN